MPELRHKDDGDEGRSYPLLESSPEGNSERGINVPATGVTGEMVEDQIDDGAVTNPKIAMDAVDAAEIRDAAVTQVKIALAAVDTAQLADAAVDNTKLENLAVTAAKIADGNITTPKLGDASVETIKLGTDAVTSAKIANLAVDTAHINDAAIVNAKIDTAAVDSAEIALAAITSAKIADAAVGSAAIASAAIGTAHIQDAAVATAKIDSAAITTAKIADLAVVDAKIDTVKADKIEAGTIWVGGKINAGGAELGKNLRGTDRVGLTLSDANWQNIFMRDESDGMVWFRVNYGGSEYIDFRTSRSPALRISGLVEASTITSSQVRTSNSGKRVVLDAEGVWKQDAILLPSGDGLANPGRIFGVTSVNSGHSRTTLRLQAPSSSAAVIDLSEDMIYTDATNFGVRANEISIDGTTVGHIHGGNHLMCRSGDAAGAMLRIRGDIQRIDAVDYGLTKYVKMRASSFETASSREYKTNIEPFDGLSVVRNAPSKSWEYKDDADNPEKGAPGVRHVGPMLEDLPPAFFHADDGNAVRLNDMVGALWSAVGELIDRVEALE